jgi:hypothetical protein
MPKTDRVMLASEAPHGANEDDAPRINEKGPASEALSIGFNRA